MEEKQSAGAAVPRTSPAAPAYPLHEKIKVSMRPNNKPFPFIVTLIVLGILAGFVLWSAPPVGPATEKVAFVPNRSLNTENRRARILAIASAIASSGTPLTVAERELFFESLGGPRMLQYRFSQAEKLQIIKALNAGEKSATSSNGRKKKSV